MKVEKTCSKLSVSQAVNQTLLARLAAGESQSNHGHSGSHKE